ncbi:putative fad-dependent oxidoreductase-like enzyme [Diaporthe ampelina]|uniref:Putative fad-dependent oxidoreductase-like enzyme n=1 Tax=Diaporthe ampelina TaxID=1214573 RepID=A0A0G2F3Q5_9PEZI|nr:putative fad-dependent oxidoreductase-like enzyme [Diaporthe ampelina]
MLQACIADHTRLKTEAAHHKLQYQLLSVRADEDAHRAAVEQELTLRQLETLRRQKTEAPAPPARKIPSPSPEISQAMYDQLRDLGEKAIKDNEKIRKDYDEACKRLKAAKKLIVYGIR